MPYGPYYDMGQIPQDGNFGQNVAFFLKVEYSCDQTWWDLIWTKKCSPRLGWSVPSKGHNWPRSIEKSSPSYQVWSHEGSTLKKGPHFVQNFRPGESDPYMIYESTYIIYQSNFSNSQDPISLCPCLCLCLFPCLCHLSELKIQIYHKSVVIYLTGTTENINIKQKCCR